jgi:hypothetical protein
MTTTPSYTDEQVLDAALYLHESAKDDEAADMLRSLLADRQRLQAEVEAYKRGEKWHVLPLTANIAFDLANRFDALANASCEPNRSKFFKAMEAMDELHSILPVAGAKQNETKEAKS